jgi:hypothetical protein
MFSFALLRQPITILLQTAGCILVTTKQAIIVGEYEAPVDWVEAQQIVVNLANHLMTVGY